MSLSKNSSTKIRDQILTESIHLQFHDFITVIWFSLLSKCITVSIVWSKDNESFEDLKTKWLFLNQRTLMAEGFAKYSVQNFVKKLDKVKCKRLGIVRIYYLVMERAPYDVLQFKIAEAKEL